MTTGKRFANSQISRSNLSPPSHWGDSGPLEVNLPLLKASLYWVCWTSHIHRPGQASDNHLQLPGILDDLFGQFSRGDGAVFWLLLLAGKAVVVVRAQHPTSLLGIVCHLFGCAEEEDPGSLSKKDFLIGLLNASCDPLSSSRKCSGV